jgi:hypothetical protein
MQAAPYLNLALFLQDLGVATASIETCQTHTSWPTTSLLFPKCLTRGKARLTTIASSQLADIQPELLSFLQTPWTALAPKGELFNQNYHSAVEGYDIHYG